MSLGSDLLELQDVDLALRRNNDLLNNMPEMRNLAKKRTSYAKLKADATRILGLRKDSEMELEYLDGQRAKFEAAVERAQEGAQDATDYRAVQDLEVRLSDLAKQLDKTAFAREAEEKKLAEIRSKEGYLADYIKKFEAGIVADTRAVKAKAGDLIDQNKELEARRKTLRSHMDATMLEDYDEALVSHGGLAVERLEGNKPSVCRVSLQASSMGDLKDAGEVARCPYCHRILVRTVEETEA